MALHSQLGSSFTCSYERSFAASAWTRRKARRTRLPRLPTPLRKAEIGCSRVLGRDGGRAPHDWRRGFGGHRSHAAAIRHARPHPPGMLGRGRGACNVMWWAVVVIRVPWWRQRWWRPTSYASTRAAAAQDGEGRRAGVVCSQPGATSTSGH